MSSALDGSCRLRDLSASQSTLVNPGGETRCIFNTALSGPFQFQVWPGASDKLLLYFQGGGACWDKLTTEAGLCTTTASPAESSAIFCREGCPSANPFSEYTIVHVLYCSGDAHIGNTVRDYDDKDGDPVTQVGGLNVQSALDWIIDQDDYFTRFSSLLLMGCSAGSLGVQAWATEALLQLGDAYGYDGAAVVPDSYAGVFPPGTEGTTIKDFGACYPEGVLAFDESLQQACEDGNMDLPTMTSAAMSTFPDVPFAFINSKDDEVQISYYVAIAETFNTSAAIDPAFYYEQVNEIFGGYAVEHANVVEFIVQSDQHCYTPNAHFWTADVTSSNGGGTGITMLDWLAKLPMQEGETIETECLGADIDDLDKIPAKGTRYCYTELEKTIDA